MRRIALAVSTFAVLTAVAWPIAEGLRAEPSLCDQMTTAKMLEQPGIADEYARALHSGEWAEIERVEALLRGIRAAHGCGGDAALPMLRDRTPRLPPGHPPIGNVPGAPATTLPFEAPQTYTI